MSPSGRFADQRRLDPARSIGRWDFEEFIVYLETWALVKAVTREALSSLGRDACALFLGDNLSVSLACARSQSRDFKLLSIIRRVASLSLSRGLTVDRSSAGGLSAEFRRP